MTRFVGTTSRGLRAPIIIDKLDEKGINPYSDVLTQT